VALVQETRATPGAAISRRRYARRICLSSLPSRRLAMSSYF